MARGRALSGEGREETSRGIVCGGSGRVARRLGRHSSVVNREIDRNGGWCAYQASDAQRRAVICRRRPKLRRVEADPRLLVEVNRGLALRWSPPQISHKLRRGFPDDEVMRVPQGDLLGVVRAGEGVAEGAAGRVPAQRSRPPCQPGRTPRGLRDEAGHPQHGHDRRAVGRGGGPGRAWALGR